jgi:hypothetical protein
MKLLSISLLLVGLRGGRAQMGEGSVRVQCSTCGSVLRVDKFPTWVIRYIDSRTVADAFFQEEDSLELNRAELAAKKAPDSSGGWWLS